MAVREERLLTVARDSAAATLAMDRPDRRNALSSEPRFPSATDSGLSGRRVESAKARPLRKQRLHSLDIYHLPNETDTHAR